MLIVHGFWCGGGEEREGVTFSGHVFKIFFLLFFPLSLVSQNFAYVKEEEEEEEIS